MVIVDSRVAFAGGLDLCFGRYDSHSHRMADPADLVWPGQDFNNVRLKDFANVEQHDVTLIDRQFAPRMPWHDVSYRIRGSGAYDIARHFCERWNFVRKDKYLDNPLYDVITPSLQESTEEAEQNPGSCRVQVVRSSSEWSSGVETEHSVLNAYLELIEKAEYFIYIENQFFISNPTGEEDYEISNTIAKALVERILRAVSEGKPFRVIVSMPLMPAFPDEVDGDGASSLRVIMHWQYKTISRGGKSIFELLAAQGIRAEDYITFYGLRNYDLIRDASQYQGFDAESDAPAIFPRAFGDISSTEEGRRQEQQLAEQPQEEEEKNENSLLKHLHLPAFVKSLISGDKEELKTEEVPDGEAKVEAENELEEGAMYVSELVYIHTKLMIVDDRTIICGSANINDRSMLGVRDSEIAVVVEDQDFITTRMNGEEWQAGRKAHELRCRIFREHLGLSTETQMRVLAHLPPFVRPSHQHHSSVIKDIAYRANRLLEDPLSRQFFDLWTTTAQRNTEVYRDMFRCVPDDTVRTWDQYKEFMPDVEKVLRCHTVKKEMTKRQVRHKLSEIQGHLVEFPTHFLEEEVLRATNFSAESLMPEDLYT